MSGRRAPLSNRIHPTAACSLASSQSFNVCRGGKYTLAFLLTVLGSFAAVLRSRVGLALAAIREEEERASLLGLRTVAWKLLAFALSALFTALAGGLYVHTVGMVEPGLVFSTHFSILPLVMATVGGLHTLFGPVAAAFVLYLASELLFHPYAPGLHQLPYALALVAAVLYLPGGLAGLLTRRRRAAP